ncbi:MAG: glyoxalase/bleomycin resistance/extradiol dioxygenase family protein [Pseudomonadota bacterium]
MRDVVAALADCRNRMGFEIAWHNAAGRIGAFVHGDWALFFREIEGAIRPAVCWILAEDIDGMFRARSEKGAEIVERLEDRRLGAGKFSLRDLRDPLIRVHHDLDA